jgi:hypothetical protein
LQARLLHRRFLRHDYLEFILDRKQNLDDGERIDFEVRKPGVGLHRFGFQTEIGL